MKDEIKAAANELFNWKEHPSSVFLFAVPIALIGFILLGMVAYLHWELDGDPWYAVIVAAGLLLLAVGIWPVRKQLRHLL